MRRNNFSILLLIISILLISLQCSTEQKAQSSISELEVNKSDWIDLLNSSPVDIWQSVASGEFPDEGWEMTENVLTVKAKTDSTPGGKDIITKNQYSNFELELEVKLTQGANSGIKYFVTNDFPGFEGSYLGLEYQLIDDDMHPDAILGNNGNRTMASLYDLIPPLKNKTVYPPGEWNKVKIVVDGDYVQHWLNGLKVLEFNRKSDSYRQLVNLSKYDKFVNFGEAPEGHILLQGHNDEVSFRQIKIRTW